MLRSLRMVSTSPFPNATPCRLPPSLLAVCTRLLGASGPTMQSWTPSAPTQTQGAAAARKTNSNHETTVQLKIGGCHHNQSLHSTNLETRGEKSNAATERPREDSNLARTDGDERPTVAHRRSVHRVDKFGTSTLVTCGDRCPMTNKYDGNGLRGRARSA